MPTQHLLLPLTLLFLLPSLPLARPEYRARIPNGANTDNSGITCEHLGHVGCIPGAERNPFGLDFARFVLGEGQVWREELCALDSDGDGITNGEELGDPCCVWTEGDTPARVDTLSHPGEPSEMGAAAAPNCAALQAMQSGGASPSSVMSPVMSMAASPVMSTAASPVMSMAASPVMAPEEESSDESPAPDEDDDPVCFPAHARVKLADGSERPMADLEVGDRVWVSERETSEVFMFTHRVEGRLYDFVTLRAGDAHGNVVASVSLTKGHYLYVNGELQKAGRVVVGDEVDVAGERRRVVAVECAKFTGLYNPQTVHGDLVVDGVRVSTYTTAVEAGKAHSLLAPLRLVYKIAGWSMSALEQGADRVVKLLP